MKGKIKKTGVRSVLVNMKLKLMKYYGRKRLILYLGFHSFDFKAWFEEQYVNKKTDHLSFTRNMFQ